VNRSHNGYFVDLYVRRSNSLAKALYAKLGYTRYRTVLGYYSGSEDAWGAVPFAASLNSFADMRKALPRDKLQKSLVAPKDVVSPDEVE
jgi:N-terminal acetyltransferase B complex catalytic subunit